MIKQINDKATTLFFLELVSLILYFSVPVVLERAYASSVFETLFILLLFLFPASALISAIYSVYLILYIFFARRSDLKYALLYLYSVLAILLSLVVAFSLLFGKDIIGVASESLLKSIFTLLPIALLISLALIRLILI
ncbi:hypothetical protein CH362_18850 [Leptospira saintgironsiae]|uniref:Uncharacterized protein n=1 Tax=Leptospira saintgironsiae TaxID=2023183 RepID=A0A2M9Y7D3_9LEPT|nr:hypothetical protein CH362_18850 [Leptospira saintgironsiae]